MDTKNLFALDPMASISYAQYNAVKKDKGSFEDFLLHYDSHEANEGGSKWLNRLIKNEGGYEALASNPELVSSLKDLNLDLDFSSYLNTSKFLDTKIEVLKMMSLLKK